MPHLQIADVVAAVIIGALTLTFAVLTIREDLLRLKGR